MSEFWIHGWWSTGKKREPVQKFWRQSILHKVNTSILLLSWQHHRQIVQITNKQITWTDESLFGSYMRTLNYKHFSPPKIVGLCSGTLKSFCPDFPLLKVISDHVLIMFQALMDFKRPDKGVPNRSSIRASQWNERGH